jgi:4-aminobutyrate aminotransferase
MERWPNGAHGNTYGGNPVCCAAASKTLELVRDRYLANAGETGAWFMDRLKDLMKSYECIGEVRGLGFMIGMELVRNRKSREPAPDLCTNLIRRAFQNGLLLLSCGTSTVRFMPPLVLERAQVDEAMEILKGSLDEALSSAAAA